MAESERGAKEASEQQNERKHPSPPNKKRYEEAMETLAVAISNKEAELAAHKLAQKMVCKSFEDTCLTEIRNTRAAKESTVTQRKKIDAELKCLNQEISKQMSHLTKLQSSLQYKNEERITEAMRRLDYQLVSHNFTLSEEKKIVAEIDSLKRSKKVLEQFLILKKEIDGMREHQKTLRDERDSLHKTVTHLKTQEDRLRKQKTKSEFLRKEIDELYERKRANTAQFKGQEREYQLLRDAARKKFQSELTRKKSVEKQAQQAALRRERRCECKMVRDPFNDELQLCSTLKIYLQRFLTNTDTNTTTHSSDASSANSGSSPECNSCQVKYLEAAGLYVLKKKDEDLFCGITRQKCGKRSKRDKRKQSPNKPIVHTPDIFAQFSCLCLRAPSTLTEVASAVDMLDAKMEYYTNRRLAVGDGAILGDATSNSDHDGSAESAICESFPSTPDVQLDNVPPTFAMCGTDTEVRRLSHDSGTCEGNEGLGCDEDEGTMLNRSSPVGDDAIRASCPQCDDIAPCTCVTTIPTDDVTSNTACDEQIIIANELQDGGVLLPVQLLDSDT